MATRQHHGEVWSSRVEMIHELHGGPRSAKKKEGFIS